MARGVGALVSWRGRDGAPPGPGLPGVAGRGSHGLIGQGRQLRLEEGPPQEGPRPLSRRVWLGLCLPLDASVLIVVTSSPRD